MSLPSVQGVVDHHPAHGAVGSLDRFRGRPAGAVFCGDVLDQVIDRDDMAHSQ
jgi:hypothetical protein